MPRAAPRNQKSQSQKRQPSQSLVPVEQQSHEAAVLAKIQETGLSLEEASGLLIEDARRKLRGRRHDITHNKGVVEFLNDAINAFILDPNGSILGRNELNTLAYTCGVQLRAIQAVQDEEKPADSLNDLLGNGLNVEIRMTKEERKMFLTAGSVDNMAKVLQEVKKDGRIIDVEAQPDGSFAVRPLNEPPRTDAPMPVGEIQRAMSSEGIDINRKELQTLVGPSLGSNAGGETVADELEMFGFEDVYSQTPKTEPRLAHSWETVSYNHPQLDDVVVRVSRCTKCGITTKNSKLLEDELCGVEE